MDHTILGVAAAAAAFAYGLIRNARANAAARRREAEFFSRHLHVGGFARGELVSSVGALVQPVTEVAYRRLG
jgi:hypothetical protein